MAVEELDRPVAVVAGQHPPEPPRLSAVGDELLDVRERIDDEREPREADEHDQERVQLRPRDVAIDEHASFRSRPFRGERKGVRDRRTG